MHSYKVFIPCAGIGSRLGSLVTNINKGLVSVDNKPVLSHIIDKFDDDIEIVVALGYKGDYVKQFLEIAYPNRNFTFEYIDNYDKEGSGLGHTLLCCKKHLQSEFIFIVNDLIITDEIPSLQKMAGLSNWIGYSDVVGSNHYRTIAHNEGKLTNLYEKNENPNNPTYIGICGIKDYKSFWSFSKNKNFVDVGESYSIQQMVKKGMKFETVKFDFYDSGHIETLTKARENITTENSPVILEKPDESIWFVGGKVIKFNTDKDFIKNRAKRSKSLIPYVPKVLDVKDNMYSYKKVNGTIFSEAVNTENFKFLLDWLREFHKPVECDKEEFKNNCLSFYKDKTYDRVNEYFKRFNNSDSTREVINGTPAPSVKYLLDKIDWDWIADGVAVRFHGDLHFENILASERNNHNTLPITLLDWRQDFCGRLDYGDVYYDLAKLMHGLIVSHDIINDDMYSFDRSMNEIKYDFLRKNINIDCEGIFLEYIAEWGYDVKKVKVMTALIFLNIAKFHHYPYSHLLFYLGKNLLNTGNKDAK